ncbi:RNA polymerase subunit sigma-24, partial [Pseudomonas sp. CrR25]|nr:RNA polymerase subunit sigma-24 [Pseudomonas sp. CrR25]
SVLAFIADALRGYWSSYEWQIADINGGRGVLLRAEGQLVALVTFAYDEAGRASNIYIMRNPDKLARLDARTGGSA